MKALAVILALSCVSATTLAAEDEPASRCLTGLSENWVYPRASSTHVFVIDHTVNLGGMKANLFEKIESQVKAGDSVYIYGFGHQVDLTFQREAMFRLPKAPQLEEAFLPHRIREQIVLCLQEERKSYVGQVVSQLNTSLQPFQDDHQGRSQIAFSLREIAKRHRDGTVVLWLLTDGMENSHGSTATSGVTFYRKRGLNPAPSQRLARELSSLLPEGSLPGNINFRVVGVGSGSLRLGSEEIQRLIETWELALRHAGATKLWISSSL